MVKEDALGFSLANANETFANRQRAVFGEVDRLETAHPPNRLTQEELEEEEEKARGKRPTALGRRPRTPLTQFKGKASMFRRADLPARKNLKVLLPDYVKNPHKWRRYTLSDTPDESLTEESNRAAAFAFLRSLRPKGGPSGEGEEAEAPPHKVLFNRRLKEEEAARPSPAPLKTVYFQRKFLMPEYVVGQKVAKKAAPTPKREPAETSNARVQLAHLDDIDE